MPQHSYLSKEPHILFRSEKQLRVRLNDSKKAILDNDKENRNHCILFKWVQGAYGKHFGADVRTCQCQRTIGLCKAMSKPIK